MATYSPPESAVSRLLQARIALALRHPYLATATMRLPVRKAPDQDWCATMATDGYHIWYSENWVLGLDSEALIGVIAHEVLHVVFGHVDRVGSRDRKVWNEAADHAINLLLSSQGQRIPDGGYCAGAFRGMATEEIYERLASESPRSRTAWVASLHQRGDLSDGTASMPLQASDLLDPDDLRIAALASDDAPDRAGRRELRRQLVSGLREELHGTAAGMIQRELERAVQRPIDWARLLRQWLFDRARSDWRTYPFSKRHLHRGMYMPSPTVEAPGHVVFAVDTSASMSDEDVARAFGEVRALRETFPSRLTVVQCDAGIQKIDEYGQFDGASVPDVVTIIGRGGTDFRPVFAWLDEEESVAAMPILVYLTDGYGTFPKEAPSSPCVWLVTTPGQDAAKFPFGEVIKTAPA